MREIKFKYYVVRENGFVFSKIFDIRDIELGQSERFLENNHAGDLDKVLKRCQFTGLTDKNGKECYEGDILTNSVAKWEVIFNTGCFCAKLIDKKAAASEVHLALRGVKNFEIIGNIYENPELLNL